MRLFRPEAVEFQQVRLKGDVVLADPVSLRILVTIIMGIVIAASVWVVLGTYARIETIPGILVTEDPSAKIIAPAQGTVIDLLVEEGQLVKKGERLAVIGLDRHISSDIAVAAKGLESLTARTELGNAQMALLKDSAATGRKRILSTLESALAQATNLEHQISLQRQVVESNQMMFDQIAPVFSRGFISKFEHEQRKQALIASQQSLASLEEQIIVKKAAIRQARMELDGLAIETAQNMSDLQSNLHTLSQQRVQLQGEKGYIIKAPVDGRVTALQVEAGATVTPAAPVMTIVPAKTKLRAEAYAPNRAVGRVQPGQEVRLLYDAFPYQRFGSFKGRVAWVSRTVIDPKDNDAPLHIEEPTYRVSILLDQQSLNSYGTAAPLHSGMTLDANIVLERQSFLDWLLTPFNAVRKRSS